MKKISIIIPAYNEEESLSFLFERLNKITREIQNYEFEILLINDGSKDKTLEIIKEQRKQDNRISYVDLSRNFGKETAMIAGLDYATGDAVIFMDADLQDPPELIPELIKHWEEGYDDVYARRKTRKGETFVKKFTSKMYYKILQKIAGMEIQRDTGESLQDYAAAHEESRPRGVLDTVSQQVQQAHFKGEDEQRRPGLHSD